MLKQCSRRTLVVLLAFLPACALAGPAAQRFTLGKYVPHDCFLCMHAVHNPERELIEAHWSRVFEEVKKSSIDAELKRLIVSGMCAADRADFEQSWDTAVKLFHGVRWGDLMAKEFVFAERFGAITPDIIILCRSSADSVQSNVHGLKAILDTLASLGENASVTESVMHGVKVWSLGAPKFPISLHLFNKGDVIGVVVGHRAVNDVLALVAGEKAAKAIVDLPRFKKAVAGLPAAENSLVYFDVQTFMRSLNRMFETVLTQKSAESKELRQDPPRPEQFLIANILGQCDFIDYVMTSARTEGLREIAVTTARLRPDAMDKPLCRAFTAQKPFERFDKYIPKEATGFWVSSFVDLQILYQFILGFIRDQVPEGPAALDKWAEIQTGINFDVEADLFSWWSGEIVSVSLPSVIRGPSPLGNFVLLIRVKNARLAEAKVSAGIDRLAAFAREHDQPLMISSNGRVDSAGFRSVTHSLVASFGLKFIIGVVDDQLVIGNSAAAINACLTTAAGKAPSIMDNERFKKEGLIHSGPVCGASFSDLSNLGQELGSMFAMMGMFGSFIPDKPETRPLKAMINTMGRLSPAMAQIDFLSSSATVCTFDGQAWTTTQVMNYKPAQKRPPASGKVQTQTP